jgi:tetratricopeptide (TPR) repeat protein
MRALALSLVAVFLPVAAALAAGGPVSASCNAGDDTPVPDRVSACSALIRSGQAGYDVYVLRAAAYADGGDRAAAIADLSAAILLRPDSAAAYATRGTLYLKDESFRDGLVDLDRSLELDPKDEAALRTRAFAWDELGNYPSAIADYTALLALSGDASYRYFRGSA